MSAAPVEPNIKRSSQFWSQLFSQAVPFRNNHHQTNSQTSSTVQVTQGRRMQKSTLSPFFPYLLLSSLPCFNSNVAETGLLLFRFTWQPWGESGTAPSCPSWQQSAREEGTFLHYNVTNSSPLPKLLILALAKIWYRGSSQRSQQGLQFKREHFLTQTIQHKSRKLCRRLWSRRNFPMRNDKGKIWHLWGTQLNTICGTAAYDIWCHILLGLSRREYWLLIWRHLMF